MSISPQEKDKTGAKVVLTKERADQIQEEVFLEAKERLASGEFVDGVGVEIEDEGIWVYCSGDRFSWEEIDSEDWFRQLIYDTYPEGFWE